MKVIINDEAYHKKGFSISTDQNLLDFDTIYHYLDKESYWAKGIPADRLRIAIVNSMCFGVYHYDKQIGFARIISDKATFAYLADVFVLNEYRGQGLSKWLMQTIREHPDLQGLRRWSLATADAHGLYQQFGFTVITNPERWMEIFSPYLTQN
ncbi:GNAT family N-acetyltransferase [Mucilaginibacter boryungensis]|uniref:GNAT family N-acetyltransferase n=1 Tax=Mucilaginibacter boryungensis TaxID=768480 RepID=A0ABR9XGZ0_9SPHI|nr:GNAT family N-acetyltransferase [Mucilaginibacter boryungensis]MBE9666259.1 GNAT family N-acetyltransferase [Mucilaginibacter boryungensis]